MDPQPDRQIPFEYLCPISHYLMSDPVITVDGHTFDRVSITQWFNTGHTTNPLTNKELSSTQLIANRALRSLIQAMVEKASGDIGKGVPGKVKHFLFNVNQEVGKKFPHLVDDFGMMRVNRLEKIVKQNQKLKLEKEELKTELQKLQAQITHEKNQIKFRFPDLYNGYQLNLKALDKLIKQKNTLAHQNQEFCQKLKYWQQNAAPSRAKEPDYGADELVVRGGQLHYNHLSLVRRSGQHPKPAPGPPNNPLHPHHRKYPQPQPRTRSHPLTQSTPSLYPRMYPSIYIQLYYVHLLIECMLWVMCQSNSMGYVCRVGMMSVMCVEQLECKVEVFAKALANDTFVQLQQLTLKIHHDLFDSKDTQPLVDAINILPQLQKLTLIVDPLYTIYEKNWTCRVDKHVLVQVLVK